MAENLRHALIRVYDYGLTRNHGNVVVAEVLQRRVDVLIHARWLSFPGAVLIDSTDALGAIAELIGHNSRILIVIRSTDELLWAPMKAEMSAGDYWTIECVPWIEYLRAACQPDQVIIERAHQQNEE